MIVRTPTATLLLSVDVPPAQEESPLISELLNLLRHHRAPALWSLDFHRKAPVVDRIQGGGLTHEFGILASSPWAGRHCTRAVFQRELVRRLHHAQECNVSVRALAMSDDEFTEHFDLMVKHQLALLRARIDREIHVTGGVQPRLARYGIWESHPTLTVPVASRWSLPWTARRLFQQAESQRHSIHIAIDGAQLDRHRAAGVRTLDYLLKLASSRRDAGQLMMLSFREFLEMCTHRRVAHDSQSILRAA